MGQARIRKAEIASLKGRQFPISTIQRWEESKCAAFGVALAQKTHWALHADWLVNDKDTELPTFKHLLRVYVGTDLDDIFDANGIYPELATFNKAVIWPIINRVSRRQHSPLFVRTKVYDAFDYSELASKGIHVNSLEVADALTEINKNPGYLAEIPGRSAEELPAKPAFDFAFGLCALYAQALHEVSGLPVVEFHADSYRDGCQMDSGLGYVHTAVAHPDGRMEDSWGVHSVNHIARRYFTTTWHLDAVSHTTRLDTLKLSSPDEFDKQLTVARALVSKYYRKA